MTTIKVNTTQNVLLEYELASLGDRILAFLLDVVIIAAVFILLGLLFSSTEIEDIWIFFFIVQVLPLFYSLVFETLFNGQTPGKIAMKIKVIKLNGRQPNFGDYFLRWIFQLVDIALTSGGAAVLAIVLSKKGQRIGDMVAGTSVVKMKVRTTMEDTIFSDVEEDYVPVFEAVRQFTDSEISIIKEVLSAYKNQPYNSDNRKLLNITRVRIQEKMDLRSNMEDLAFLETLVKDYNFYTSRD